MKSTNAAPVMNIEEEVRKGKRIPSEATVDPHNAVKIFRFFDGTYKPEVPNAAAFNGPIDHNESLRLSMLTLDPTSQSTKDLFAKLGFVEVKRDPDEHGNCRPALASSG